MGRPISPQPGGKGAPIPTRRKVTLRAVAWRDITAPLLAAAEDSIFLSAVDTNGKDGFFRQANRREKKQGAEDTEEEENQSQIFTPDLR